MQADSHIDLAALSLDSNPAQLGFDQICSYSDFRAIPYYCLEQQMRIEDKQIMDSIFAVCTGIYTLFRLIIARS